MAQLPFATDVARERRRLCWQRASRVAWLSSLSRWTWVLEATERASLITACQSTVADTSVASTDNVFGARARARCQCQRAVWPGREHALTVPWWRRGHPAADKTLRGRTGRLGLRCSTSQATGHRTEAGR